MNRKRIKRLAVKFREQEKFSTGYSPLYTHLFGTVASWLESPNADADPLVNWLIDVSINLRSLSVTLLLAAGLHKTILAKAVASLTLAQFYPSAGGYQSPDSTQFVHVLHEAIWNSRQELTDFMLHQQVQTNETGRGLCWLLPLYITGWSAVHLVDLGASAGLNLVADKRAYRLISPDAVQEPQDIGEADPIQFEITYNGRVPLPDVLGNGSLPSISSRTGCDLAPFPLETYDDELTLISFIWADQIERLERLREGISAFIKFQQSDSPVHLFPADLPDELESFLKRHLATDEDLPVVIYNTFMTVYLHDRGQSLGTQIDKWAQDKDQPVLWLQWEPAASEHGKPEDIYAESGWCRWTADLWTDGHHQSWILGWAHPHGKAIELSRGFIHWQNYWHV